MMKITKTRYGILIGLIIFLLIFISPLTIFVQADDNGEVNEDFQKLNQRVITVENHTDFITIESVLASGENEGKLIYNISKGDGKLNFKTIYTASSGSSENEPNFDLIFNAIIEYVDVDANGIYNESIDTTLQQFPLNNFSSIRYWNQLFSDNMTIHIINITTVDGIFSTQIYVVEAFENISTHLIGPNEMKLDISIQNFNFKNDSSNLALKVGLISSATFQSEEQTQDEQEGFASDEEGVQTIENNFPGFFSWSKLAKIDGISRMVNSSPVSYDEGMKNDVIYLSYSRGNITNHDPKIGVAGILRFPGGLDVFLIVMIAVAAITVLAVSVVMVKAEYREYLLSRILHIDSAPHRLSLEEVLENENRSLIINLILEEPGIHFNEILRKVGISAGNLAWHLDILESYKIIQKQRVGQYLVYYSYLEKNPFTALDPKLMKSKTTLEILQLIGDNPGMYQNQIANRLDLNHKTVKYHLEKLLEVEMIYAERTWGRQRFYPIIRH